MDRKSRLPLSTSKSRLPLPNSAGRSRSSTSISRSGPPSRSRSATPSSAYRRQKSPLIKKDTRPLDNKKWQKEQTARVEAFVRQYEPTITKLRPLSTNIFVTVLHHLMKAVDASSNITASNYKSELPDILRLFNYPNKLSPSIIKWPNTDHAYPAILGVWSFLLDKIEDLEVMDLYQDIKCKLTGVDLEMANYLPKFAIQSYAAANIGALTLEDIHAEIEHILITNPKEYRREQKELDALRNKISSEEEEVKKLNLELADLVETIASRKDATRKQQESIKKRKNYLDDVLKKLEDKREILDQNIEHKHTELADLQKKIDPIGVSKENVAEMEQNIVDIKHTNSLQNERHEANMNKITQLDLHLAQQKRQIESTVFGINNTLRDIVCLIDDIEICFLPETGFTHLNYLEIIKENDVAVFPKKLHDMERDLKDYTQNKERFIKEREKKLSNLQSDYSEELISFKRYTEILESVKNEVNSLENRVEVLHREIGEIERSKIDVKQYIDLNVEAQARKEKLTDALRKQNEEMKEISLETRKISVETNCKLIKSMECGLNLLHSQLQKESHQTSLMKLSQLKKQLQESRKRKE